MRDLSEAAKDVLAERHRQGKVEGWTTESDDQYAYWEMTRAAVCYAQQSAEPKKVEEGSAPYGWPWHSSWWKPTTPRRNLVKAGALILAEIERIDRAAHPAGQSIGPGAERDQVDAGLIQMLIADNARMRAAGTKLSEASLRVIREYDGTHRLSLAVAEWAEAIASEGGRAERFKPAPDSTRTGQVGAKWVMVPAEPTQAMWAAFRNADAGSIAFTKAYHAMIAARPAAPEAQGAEHPDDSTIGTAVQAIEWAIGIDDHYDRLEFLKAWSEGDLKEWPDFATFVHGTEPAPPASSGQESAR
ncbi:hypothetical protein [Methylorubrum extorquens]|uniref:hypothetical protein n=1 Tax=Methylorubrum extorquens TaxID=408 RepID=UPI0022389F75|nr:hypothetical protein [Methylorubrum extorquens]UYW34429.1 hypothetical protein OKB92_10225 [Methylorubrum extorquens]